jgi:hypothetical protein
MRHLPRLILVLIERDEIAFVSGQPAAAGYRRLDEDAKRIAHRRAVDEEQWIIVTGNAKDIATERCLGLRIHGQEAFPSATIRCLTGRR